MHFEHTDFDDYTFEVSSTMHTSIQRLHFCSKPPKSHAGAMTPKCELPLTFVARLKELLVCDASSLSRSHKSQYIELTELGLCPPGE